jgi:uncharacterized protein
MSSKLELQQLKRIAEALERLAPARLNMPNLSKISAFVWQAQPQGLKPIVSVNRVDLNLLQGIDLCKAELLDNTEQFAKGFMANNALLWGARGMGKSSLVKAVHATVSSKPKSVLKIIEIHREDIAQLPILMATLRSQPNYRFIVFCDDLAFDSHDTTYKSLKAALDGGLEGRPTNVIFYATSNRRHLLPREMIENEQSTAINPAEVVQEKVSLSDRFGLWLGFHQCDQEDFFAMLDAYAAHYKLIVSKAELHAAGIEWSVTRGSRSGRVAWQLVQSLAGKQGIKLD